MNKIAFIADIHSNITALNAVLKDIKDRNVNKIICLGDMIGKGPSPDLVIDTIKKECFDVIIGNLEISIIDVETKEHGIWNRNKLGNERIKYIKSLNYKNNIKIAGKNVSYFHTISKDNYLTDVTRVQKDSSKEDKLKLFEVNKLNKSDIVVYADIHYQYSENIGKKLIINTGSVGNKLTDKVENICAEYVILSEKEDKSLDLQFIKVPYSKEKEIDIVNNSDMPHKEKYITEILTGKYVNV